MKFWLMLSCAFVLGGFATWIGYKFCEILKEIESLDQNHD